MSGIDFGLAAADQYYKADDARVLREQQRQRADAELSLLPDKVAAERSGLKLKNAQNNANLDLVPNQAAVSKALSDFSVEELPSKIAQLRQQRIFSDVDAQTVSVAKLADLIQMGDPAQITKYINDMNTANGWNSGKAPVAQVGFTKNDKGENVFMALDANGQPVMQMGAGQIQRIKDSIGKTDLKVLKPGDTLYGVKNGQATPMGTAPVNPDLVKGVRNQHTPAEIQTMNWLMDNKVAKDPANAWELVRSSREKTRQSFILDYVGKNTLPGQDPNKVSSQAGQIYDELQRANGKGGSGQSNSPAQNTLDPRVNSLIGLPSQ